MATQPVIKPEWLETIDCCSAKVQMDLIRAIVAWQTDGTVPDFRGAKKAIFLLMVRDLDPTAAAHLAAIKPPKREKPAKSTEATETTKPTTETELPEPQPEPQPQQQPEPQPEPAPKPTSAFVRKRKNSPRYFCGRPLY
ncbi:MAG: hypothetical protein NC241_03445 [Bacteroides sp.]|nr:hypothetical protein [Bacteroides sp.]MCM1457989.1 hypothetical protein [Lachnoclostridium sp.]